MIARSSKKSLPWRSQNLWPLLLVAILAACGQSRQVARPAAKASAAKRPVATPSAKITQAREAYEKGVAAFEAGRMEGAEEQFKLAHRQDPERVLPLYGLGLVRYQQERYEEAVEEFSKALLHRPNFSQALHGLALCRRQMGQYQEAERAYLAALRFDPRNAEYALNLGILYEVYLGKPEEALKNYREHLEWAGPSADPRVAGWIETLQRK